MTSSGNWSARLAGRWEDGRLDLRIAPPDTARSDSRLCAVNGTLIGRSAADVMRDRGSEAAMLRELRGEFALVMWDATTREGVLVRDQMGVGSLYVLQDAGGLLFADDPAWLAAQPARRPAPDETAVVQWLATGLIESGRALFTGVQRIAPGELVRLSGDSWRVEQWWSWPEEAPLKLTRAEACEAVHDAVETAIRRRLPVDGPVGVQLSGGLDSTMIGGFASRMAGQARMRSYSVVFPNHPRSDESSYIDSALGVMGGQHESLAVTGRERTTLAAAATHAVEAHAPLAPPSDAFWMPLLQTAASQGVEVMLDGNGGDEVFDVNPALLAERLRRGRLIAATRLARRAPGGGAHPSRSMVANRLLTVGLRDAMPWTLHRLAQRWRAPRHHLPPWLTPRAAELAAPLVNQGRWKQLPGPPSRAYLINRVVHFPDDVGAHHHVRRRAAAFGIEARMPLVDVDLMRLMLRLPPELSYEPELTRPLQRDAMKGLMPDDIRLRPAKRFFDAPLRSLLEGELEPLRRLVTHPQAPVRAYVDPTALRSVADGGGRATHPVGELGWLLGLWRVASMDCWLRAEEEGIRTSAPEAVLA